MALELTDQFTVPLGVEEAWKLLTDVERIAPAMPGARLDGTVEGEYQGAVRVKVGPVTVEYKGAASFESLDPEAHRLVLNAAGRETRGQGNASARVTGTLSGDSEKTVVDLSTELEITGKVAQFGRGVIADVSTKLLGQFVGNIEADLLRASTPEDASAGGPVDDRATFATSSTHPSVESQAAEPEPLNLFSLVSGSILKIALPLLGVVALVFAARILIRRR